MESVYDAAGRLENQIRVICRMSDGKRSVYDVLLFLYQVTEEMVIKGV